MGYDFCWRSCLNPYSNGLLSESLTESVLRFPHFFILQKSLLFLRELVQSEWFFRKSMWLNVSFQIKMEHFSLSSLRNRQIYLRKSDAYLNNIRYLRNRNFKWDSNLLKMNILSQRPKQVIALFFANIPIKNEKMNICETFLWMFIYSILLK